MNSSASRHSHDGIALYCELAGPRFLDVPFYRAKIKELTARSVLDLGCGTGRVLLPLMEDCDRLVGIDISAEYVEAVRAELGKGKSASSSRAEVKVGDIARLDLGEEFDLILAPFRVFQALVEDSEIDGFFQTVRRHLSPTGRAVINAFHPSVDRETLLRRWSKPGTRQQNERTLPDGSRVVALIQKRSVTTNPLVLCPDLIWRRYQGTELLDEVVKPIRMRCYYPDEFVSIVESHGFKVVEKWGGYSGELYGAGDDLVIVFS
jgi:SAM-dependent methyltransferase